MWVTWSKWLCRWLPFLLSPSPFPLLLFILPFLLKGDWFSLQTPLGLSLFIKKKNFDFSKKKHKTLFIYLTRKAPWVSMQIGLVGTPTGQTRPGRQQGGKAAPDQPVSKTFSVEGICSEDLVSHVPLLWPVTVKVRCFIFRGKFARPVSDLEGPLPWVDGSGHKHTGPGC